MIKNANILAQSVSGETSKVKNLAKSKNVVRTSMPKVKNQTLSLEVKHIKHNEKPVVLPAKLIIDLTPLQKLAASAAKAKSNVAVPASKKKDIKTITKSVAAITKKVIVAPTTAKPVAPGKSGKKPVVKSVAPVKANSIKAKVAVNVKAADPAPAVKTIVKALKVPVVPLGFTINS